MAPRRLIQPDLGAISRLLNFDEVEYKDTEEDIDEKEDEKEEMVDKECEKEDEVVRKGYEEEDGVNEQKEEVIDWKMKRGRMWRRRNMRRSRRFMQRKI